MEEKAQLSRINLKLRPEFKQDIKTVAEMTDTSVAKFIRDSIRYRFKQLEVEYPGLNEKLSSVNCKF